MPKTIDQLFPSDDAPQVTQGQWFSYGDGVSFLIASTSSAAYVTELTELLEEYPDQQQRKSAEYKQRLKGVVARHILLGWKGVEASAGEPLPYSTAAALKMLQRTAFENYVFGKANNPALFLSQKAEKDIEKNSSSASDGN